MQNPLNLPEAQAYWLVFPVSLSENKSNSDHKNGLLLWA